MIPDTINGLPVAAVGDNAFVCRPVAQEGGNILYSTVLSSVTFGSNVTRIGTNAFAQQPMTNIVFPAGLTSIGDTAFETCQSLTGLILPNSLTSIGFKSFQDCSALTNFILPDSLTSIGQEAFADCSSLTSVSFPSAVTNIGPGAFATCESLTAVSFANTLAFPGLNAFSDNKIQTVYVGGTVPGQLCFCGNESSVTNVSFYCPAGTTGWNLSAPSAYQLIPYYLMINGGFDDTGDFFGWTVTGNGNGTAQIMGPNIYSGRYAAIFTEPPGGYNLLYQTVPTQPGASYMLSFAVNGMAVNASCYLAISWDGKQLDGDFFNPGWTMHQFPVTASSSNTEVLFLIGGGNSAVNTLGIDSVSISVLAPHLTITKAGSAAIISWDPSWTGYTLQTNTTLASNTWNNYAGTVVANSTTNSAAKGKVFYRLKSQ